MTPLNEVIPVLVDRRNFAAVFPFILENVLATQMLGFDIETEDSGRHDGLNQYMKVDEDGKKSANTKLVFDVPRTTICGFSLWPEGHKYRYYFNLAHADVANRLTLEEVMPIFNQYKGFYIAHNASFELTMCRAGWKIILEKMLCSLTLCVTAYGPDEYSQEAFYSKGIENFQPLIPEAERLFRDFEWGAELTAAQGNLLGKVIAKESDASHSYNGWVSDIAYGYDLKKAVRSWFGYQMTTFQECLQGRAHMGQLTGDEVVAYGSDDAMWCVALFRRVQQYIMETNPPALQTYFEQENPMIYIYSNVMFNGIRVNRGEVEKHKHMERQAIAPVIRELRAILVAMYHQGMFQPWLDGVLHEEYAAKEKEWYRKSGISTRHKIMTWINMGDHPDNYEEVARTNGASATSWRRERGEPKREGIINLTHYYPVRVMLYDLCGVKPIVGRKKTVESDGDAQNLLLEKHGRDSWVGKIISCLKRISSIEQRIKLYITPYQLLIDPETHKIHSQMSSMLATRRMASSFPNFMQLPKSGGGAYVRSFFLPDKPMHFIKREKPFHVLLSNDWSQIELVRIAEESQDPEMLKCYQQIPYDDLHRIAYMAVMDFTEEFVARIKKMPVDSTELDGVRFEDKNGHPLAPIAYIKYLRKEIGKVSNFNYWYSGALASIGEMMGWPSDKMWEATERYRARFPVGEGWRTFTQQDGCLNGFVTICDGLRRVRFEATEQWVEGFGNKFAFLPEGVQKFFNLCMRKIVGRAKNQFVNTKIQGGCAALAKRTILRSHQQFQHWMDKGYVGFKMSIHDEIVWSVDRSLVLEFIPASKQVMCNHPDLFSSCLLDATTSIGLNFQPFDEKECAFGQIELCEAPEVSWLPKELWGGRLPDAQIETVLDYLQQGVI